MEDKYNDAIREMIDSKIEGKELVIMQEEEHQVVDIMTALKASIEEAKESKKPMEKAATKKAKKSAIKEEKRKAS